MDRDFNARNSMGGTNNPSTYLHYALVSIPKWTLLSHGDRLIVAGSNGYLCSYLIRCSLGIVRAIEAWRVRCPPQTQTCGRSCWKTELRAFDHPFAPKRTNSSSLFFPIYTTSNRSVRFHCTHQIWWWPSVTSGRSLSVPHRTLIHSSLL